jgi:hypothetical protein
MTKSVALAVADDRAARLSRDIAKLELAILNAVRNYSVVATSNADVVMWMNVEMRLRRTLRKLVARANGYEV